MKTVLGTNYKGIQIVIRFLPDEEFYLGSLRAIGRVKNKIVEAQISVGIKYFTPKATKFLIATIFHEIGHVMYAQEVLEKHGIGAYTELVYGSSDFNIFRNENLRRKWETEAWKYAFRMLKKVGLLDYETIMFGVFCLASYYSDRIESKVFFLKCLKKLVYSHLVKR